MADDLKALSEHVNYEYAQLEYLANELPKRSHEPERLRWAYAEAFLLHTRALMDFLFRPDNEVYAGNYVVDRDAWRHLCKSQHLQTATLQKARTYASQRVAHLTVVRLNTQPIPYLDIARDMETAFGEFLVMAKPELLCDALRERQIAPQQKPISGVVAVMGAVTISTSAHVGPSVMRYSTGTDRGGKCVGHT